MKKGRRIPSWLRERTRFSALCLVVAVLLTLSAIAMNRGCHSTVTNVGGRDREFSRYAWDIARVERVILVVGFVFIGPSVIWLFRNLSACENCPRWGRCKCGYNLRGNTSGFCPECGRMTGTRRPSDEGIATRMREMAERSAELPSERDGDQC